MSITVQERIRANAELVIQQFHEISDIENFGYNAASIEWVDGFIERQRRRTDLSESAIGQLSQNLASFLGECIIAHYGSEWQQQEGAWAIAFNESNAVFPFSKVRKQFANGSEDSIYSFFETIPSLFARHIQPADLEDGN